jgi:citronellol/citronellal dehydrogenase
MSVLSADANAGAVALVTGGGTGIGRATALELGRTGARVVICGRREEPLERTRTELEAMGADCLARPTDIREPEDSEALVAEAVEAFDRVDILVNNAGGQFTAPAEEITLKGWRAVHRLAVDATWQLTREVALRSMIPNRGGVIFFNTFSPRRGIRGYAHAASARAALENLAGGLAAEWGAHGIRVIALALGNIHTEGLKGYGDDLEAMAAEVPLRRLGTPEEVAQLTAFLASPAAGYVSGTTVTVDGGLDAT